uniref:Uncharacterized protein n=1 Tax=Pristionchus pacificus TaxID=54126 RepID=A0A8R1ZCL3_PRIPA
MVLLYSISLLACVSLVSSGGAPHAVGPYTGGGPVVGGGPVLGGGCIGPGCGPDYNPALLGGTRGYPGIRARMNARMFQYASQLVGELLNKEIQRARLPDITQSTQPMIEGCIVLYNAYVSRYRCPQRVVVFPKAPNHLVLQVQNLDVGVTGNLGGQINVLVPIPLTGIAQVNVHGISITVEVSIEHGPHGPIISICSCSAHVDYVDVCIENGGFVGSIANSFFRRQISDMVRDMLPNQLCKMLPKIVNEQINTKMSSIPQAIALTQLAMLAGSGLSAAPPKPDPAFCEHQCGIKMAAISTTSTAQSSSLVAPQIPSGAYGNSTRFVSARSIPVRREVVRVYRRRPAAYIGVNSVNASDARAQPVRRSSLVAAPLRRSKRATEIVLPRSPAVLPTRRVERRLAPQRILQTRGAGVHPPQQQLPISSPSAGVVASPPRSPLCNQCSASADDPAGFIRDLAQNLNLQKLNDMFLSVQLLNTYATDHDFTIDLTGEFSPGGQGGTPFGPFPTMFPAPYDNHMIEAIVSDYTLNSLFYWMHRKGFLSFRIGPETPKIGELLKTTCSEDEDDELEDHGVQIDEEERKRRRAKRRHLRHLLTHRSKRSADHRVRRQGAEEGSLSDLGICFGDILPAVREKYPNQKISIQIHTIRAPSIILSHARGGSAIVDLQADADIFIDGTTTKVGTITILAQINIALQMRGNRLYGMGEITSLKLKDNSGSLGLPQDALDNLGTLGKELLTKLANDALAKGIPINISQAPGLPVNLYNPQIVIIEHGLYVAGDITISPALLGTIAGSGTCYRY